jgi:hypothetical protein
MPPTDQDAAVRDLVERLGAARDAAAAVAGEAPLGVREVEPAAGRRAYLAAFPGPAFLCLDDRLAPESDRRRAREAASASLLWEHVEAIVDPDALRDLASAIGRLLALGGDPPEVTGPLETVGARALELAAWREDPMRAVASVPDIDAGAAIQDRLHGAYTRFMRASDPLVAVQDTLPDGLVAALRDVEEAAARAGAADRLADRLAAAMPECDDGAGQMLDADVRRARA